MRDCIEAKTAGYSADETVLQIGVAMARCGDIQDGIWMSFGRGDFVIPWADLEAAYKANAELRERLKETVSTGES